MGRQKPTRRSAAYPEETTTRDEQVDLALRHIGRYRGAGAVHFGHWDCRRSTGPLRVVQCRLRRAGVPPLALDGDCVDPTNLQLGPLRTRVEAYIAMLTG